jgi:uncharacterized protein YbjQ (UPF0145 family)
MILTTTPSVDGRPVKEWHGVVGGEVVSRPIVWGEPEEEQEIERAHRLVVQEVGLRAQKLGANAVLGITVGMAPAGGRFLVYANGTAVTLA